MATPSIDGIDMPAAVQEGLHYRFVPQAEAGRNGVGQPVYAGAQRALLTYRFIAEAQLDWYLTTLLGGLRQKAITAAELWDRNWDPVTFTAGILIAPTPGDLIAGSYRDVEIEITNLLPIVGA